MIRRCLIAETLSLRKVSASSQHVNTFRRGHIREPQVAPSRRMADAQSRPVASSVPAPDSSVLVMLTESCCHRRQNRVSAPQLIAEIVQSMTDIIGILRKFTPDGHVHCTDCVTGEFKPDAGQLARANGVTRTHSRDMQNCVRSLLYNASADTDSVAFSRAIPNAPRWLVGPGRLSDNDLSLIVLGAHLTAQGQPVFLLTNDQDILDFVSWLRIQTEARRRWQALANLQALHGLHYLDLVHHSCQINTGLLSDLINHQPAEHYNRRALAGTIKGTSIVQQLLAVNISLVESLGIKLATGVRTQ